MIRPLDPVTEPDGLYEVINGRIVEKVVSAYENILASELNGHVRDHARTHGLGRAVTEVLFDLPNVPNNRRPDAAFVSFERWPRDRGIPRTNAWSVVPDLAVEVISPSDYFRDVLERVGEYFGAGVRMVWLVVPGEDLVYVYTARTAVRVVARGDELAGDPVVPGFRLRVDDLFPPADDAP